MSNNQEKKGVGPADAPQNIHEPIDVHTATSDDFLAKVSLLHSELCKVQYNMYQWELKGGVDMNIEDARQRYLECIVDQFCASTNPKDRYHRSGYPGTRTRVLSESNVQECLLKIHDRAMQLKEKHDKSHPKYQDLKFLARQTEKKHNPK